jgi:hypothetical protein
MNRVKRVRFGRARWSRATGQVSPVIERVVTGAKEAFTETYDRFTTFALGRLMPDA